MTDIALLVGVDKGRCEGMKHQVVRVDNLMYKGCEPHWGCKRCGCIVPFHCYKKEEFEQMECKEYDIEKWKTHKTW